MRFSQDFHDAAARVDRDRAVAGNRLAQDHPVTKLAEAVRNDPVLRGAMDFEALQSPREAASWGAFIKLAGLPWAGVWRSGRQEESRGDVTAQDVAGLLGSANHSDVRPLRAADGSTKSDTVLSAVALLTAAACDPTFRRNAGLRGPTELFARITGGESLHLEKMTGFFGRFSALDQKTVNAGGGSNHRLMAAAAFNRFALGETGRQAGVGPIVGVAGAKLTETRYDGNAVDDFFGRYAVLEKGGGGSSVLWTPEGPVAAKPGARDAWDLEEGVERRGHELLVDVQALRETAASLRPRGPFGRLTETWPVVGRARDKARREAIESVLANL